MLSHFFPNAHSHAHVLLLLLLFGWFQAGYWHFLLFSQIKIQSYNADFDEYTHNILMPHYHSNLIRFTRKSKYLYQVRLSTVHIWQNKKFTIHNVNGSNTVEL